MAESVNVKPTRGRNRFTKPVDFGATNTIDTEKTTRYFYFKDELEDGGVQVSPVIVIDPSQAQTKPIRTATIIANNTNMPATFNNGGQQNYLGTYRAHLDLLSTGANVVAYQANGDIGLASQAAQTSAANTAQTITLTIENLVQILAIHMAASGGTATVTVKASVDNVNYLQIDSIAAALTTDLQYTLATNALNGAAQAGTVAGTGASTVKLNPLAFQYVQVIVGAAGIGFTTTITITAK